MTSGAVVVGLCDPNYDEQGCGEGWKMPVSRICQPNQLNSDGRRLRCEGLKFESLNYQYAFAFYWSVSATAGKRHKLAMSRDGAYLRFWG